MSFRPMSPTKPQQSLFRLTGNEKLNRRQSHKGKDRAVDDGASEPPSPSVYSFIPRPPSASSMSGGSVPTSPTSKRSSVLSTASGSSRNSTLLEFTPFRFGRKKKPPPRQNPNLRMNLILPDVLEISAANSVSTPPAGDDVNNPLEDEEARERDRLREEAAQALGLARPRDEYSESGHSVDSNGTLREEEGQEHIDASAPNNEYRYRLSPLTSTTSLHPLSLTSPIAANRNRSGSMPPAFHPQPQSPPQAPQITSVPPFPSTSRALTSFTQTASSGILPKYYPSSSLRIFAFNKQWKGRHLVLTSPVALPFTSLSGRVHVSYLHLFKSASPDERELERLEINEDSVVFVSEEEIGGRKGLVQVAGVDVSYAGSESQNASSKKDVRAREQVMWLFYIADPLEKQRWIESIKTKVFGQRTIRAGLGSSPPSSGLHEPRGDMDVMMSIRAQGIIRSPDSHISLPNSFSIQEYSATGNGHAILPTSPTTTTGSHSAHDAASVSSRSSKKVPRPSSSQSKHISSPGIANGAVLSLKGLFGSSKASVTGRPRSSSRASVINEFADPSRGSLVERNDSITALGSAKSSTVPKGNNLISILRASSPPLESNGFHSPGSSLSMGAHTPQVDFATLGINPTPIQTPQSQLERKILQSPLVREGNVSENDRNMTARPRDTEASSDHVRTSTVAQENGKPIRTLSGESFSLHPPPRKRWTSGSDVYPPNTPQSQHLQLESPYIKDHRALGDIDVLGSSPSIGRIPNGNGSLTPEPMQGSSPATKRASGQSAFSFSFGTPPGSGNLEYRPRSASSRSVHSARSGRSVHSVDTTEEPEEGEEGDKDIAGVDGILSFGRARKPSNGSGLGAFPDHDKRSSVGSGKRNSAGAKRWSRQLPKRLTPPSGPPPAVPSTPPPASVSPTHSVDSSNAVKPLPKTPQTHPYSGAAAERRVSTLTVRSTSSSRSSIGLQFSKRASVSSAVSALSTSSVQSPGVGGHSRNSSHRSSLAPPPRPAPTFALPPAPGETPSPSSSGLPSPPVSAQSAQVPTTQNKSSFRDSIASRAFRLSLMAPKPPPSMVLPPRPDEFEGPKSPTGLKSTHRRSHSSNNSPHSGVPGSLYSIPGSPIPPSNMPPSLSAVDGPSARGPLPPTPSSSNQPLRGASIKQRLRILSAPPAAPVIPSWSAARPTSPPGTPNSSFESSSFYAAATPTTPSLPAPKIHHVEDEPLEPELTSLSPAPRRGSKRISLPEVEPPPSIHEEEAVFNYHPSLDDTNSNEANKPFSLSRPGSVISFGVVNV